MRILLDPPALALLVLVRRDRSPQNHKLCLYYAAVAPLRTTVVFHNGLSPDRLANAIVEADTTYGPGEAGFVQIGNEGRHHRNILVYDVIDEHADVTLSELLQSGPRDETVGTMVEAARGPARSRQTASGQPGARPHSGQRGLP